MDVKVARECFIPKENILLYMTYDGKSIRKKVADLKASNKVYDVTCGRKISTIIMFKTGEAVLTPISVETINSRANEK